MPPSADKQRRTQEERSTETRARLIDATLDLLVERGYALATTSEIAARAGVTRGALNHHFSGKDDLIVQSVSHLLQGWIGEIRRVAELVKAGSLSLSDFVDRMWELFSGRLFLVTLEHVTAARHNPYLREQLVSVTREFHAALDGTWQDFFDGTGLQKPEVEAAFNATLCLMRGMSLQTILRDDPAYYARLLGFWKTVLAGHSQQSRAGEGAISDPTKQGMHP
ncbi:MULTISPECIES: TetR/AcrR family transcriptional regulator [Bosea]|jgi:AcrR family transcriptional regulator|uniref:TetR/AcrR family transcriptional regulator n=1 Tax=Bosea rubneri TaxID=3075434 RepID=A0ABU3S927_9HYPH|nr:MULTISPECIES: TetR/AcrR family transcriptional regulator [unclassified Bosea (in: a-proteobacteria)]MDU0341293.1 TetR/AcrR family transcriptional regulator [Bosea sp. ZW T0_25]HEV7339730.1 TetR/AcrR family transcriptional regulator [Bosea sp. (in: a-proteobacteria)]